MRRSRAVACLALLGALLLGPGLAAADSVRAEQVAPADTPAEASNGSAKNLTSSVATSRVERRRLSTAADSRQVAVSEAGGAQQVVEVLADADGVLTFRTGARAEGTTDAVTWEFSGGDAVALNGSWWTLARPIAPVVAPAPDSGRREALGVEIVDAVTGDPAADGTDEVVVVPGTEGFQVAAGAVYAFHEFTSETGERLDDEAWRAILDAGAAPARPGWQEDLFAR